MDKISKECRSKNMSNIRSKDTIPEVFLRKSLWHTGLRYRKNYCDLPGKPDIFLSKYKTAIFMHGCFWHQHQGCIEASKPKTNSDFWLKKLTKNQERDLQIKKELIEMCIQVIIVWECTVTQMMKDPAFNEKIISEIIATVKYGDELFYEF